MWKNYLGDELSHRHLPQCLAKVDKGFIWSFVQFYNKHPKIDRRGGKLFSNRSRELSAREGLL